MTPVVDSMGRIKSRLEDHACGDFSRQVVVTCISRGVRSVVRIVQIFLAKRVGGVGTYAGSACCGLKLAGALPFRPAREPQHEPVVRIVFLGEMGREEESYMGLGV
jgi:hypothetical protein